MARDAIQLGDRVVSLQVPGIFTVVDRKGSLLVIRTARGLEMTVQEPQVRRVEDETPPA